MKRSVSSLLCFASGRFRDRRTSDPFGLPDFGQPPAGEQDRSGEDTEPSPVTFKPLHTCILKPVGIE